MSTDSSSQAGALRDRRGRVYTPAIGPRLKPLLWIVLLGFALLGANGVYLSSVTFLNYARGSLQQTFFYLLMVLLHVALGILIVVPFVAFGLIHLVTAWRRPNKGAIRYGMLLLAVAVVVLISGFVLMRLELPLGNPANPATRGLKLEVRDPTVRTVGYWLHVVTPLLAVGLYLRHRMAGPRVKWEYAKVWLGGVAAFIAVMGFFHSHDPRAVRRSNDPKYTFPSEVRLADGRLISERTLMMDDYCLKCHKDAYDGWFHSAHHFSSFNNKFYLASVRETRKFSLERDGNTRAARWCAGCHDPVPFFSGAFDDPKYDDVNTQSSQAGITCTACHAITHVNSTRGNGDYTIEEPQHYPFSASESPLLQWVNNMLVRAKPEMHKQTFLKPFMRDSAFCSTCHKVSLPFALNHYQDFTRGQNHWDSFTLSGVAGGGARSFYYPPPGQFAKRECRDCHMNLVASNDFGARDFDGKGGREIHNHLFLGANTGLARSRNREDIVAAHEQFLKNKQVRVDIFGLREGGAIEGALAAPLRPSVPALEPGKKYLVETVVRTLGLGHPFSQGTVDSNEIWVELIARAGGRVIGRSGGIDQRGEVDPFAHFINVYMLDRNGNRIDRRNPQDIFVPLYNKQVPPGAGNVVHFALDVPAGQTDPITLEAKVNYRKFDRTYLDYVFGKDQGPTLPIVVMATDRIDLPIAGGAAVTNPDSPIKDVWQRWNDYGIGLLLEGAEKGGQKGELRQAEEAFKKVAELGKDDGWVNLARVYLREGRNADARAALNQATNPPAPWVVSWLTGQINDANGFLDEAIANFESVLATRIPERGFDFSRDYVVIDLLGQSLYKRSRLEAPRSAERVKWLNRTIDAYRRTLAIDSEDVNAHYGLGLAYAELARKDENAGDVLPRVSRSTATIESVAKLVEGAASSSAPASKRAEFARSLAQDITDFVAGPRPEFGGRLNPLHDAIARLQPVWDAETDPDLKAALATVLAVAHKSLHAMFKVDETAEGRAVRIARERSKAADQNAQSIVIHDLHRAGAPGLDGKASATVSRAAHSAENTR